MNIVRKAYTISTTYKPVTQKQITKQVNILKLYSHFKCASRFFNTVKSLNIETLIYIV